MSVGRPNQNIVIDEETYARNQEVIRLAEERLRIFKEMNEQAKTEYDKQQQLLELNRRIQEGEEARRQLESLSSSRLQIAAPPVSPIVEPTSNTTRIEEIGTHQSQNYPAFASSTPTQAHGGFTYPDSTTQPLSNTGGSIPIQTAYSQTAGPSYSSNNQTRQTSYAYQKASTSNLASNPYYALTQNYNLPSGNVTPYQNFVPVHNGPRSWGSTQQQAANPTSYGIQNYQTQFSAQNHTTNANTAGTSSNMPTASTSTAGNTVIDPMMIVSLISIDEVESIYKRTLDWVNIVPVASFCELPNTRCVVHKTDTGQVYIQTPPINGTPQQLAVDIFFEKWKGLIGTAQRLQINRSQAGPSHQAPRTQQAQPVLPVQSQHAHPAQSIPQLTSTHTSHTNSNPPIPSVPQVSTSTVRTAVPANSKPHPQPATRPLAHPQPQPQQLGPSQPKQNLTRNPHQEPRLQPHKLPPPAPTALLQQAVRKAQLEVNSKVQGHSYYQKPHPLVNGQDVPSSSEGSRNSPDIVQVTLQRRAPVHADKKRLAKDLLFALGKRARSDLQLDEPLKEHAADGPVQGPSSSTTAAANTQGSSTQQASSHYVSSPTTVTAPTGPVVSSPPVARPPATVPNAPQVMEHVAANPVNPVQFVVPAVDGLPPLGRPVLQPTFPYVSSAPEIDLSTVSWPVVPTQWIPYANGTTYMPQPAISTRLGRNPSKVQTNQATPVASLPVAVPQSSSVESATLVPQPSTASIKGKERAVDNSVVPSTIVAEQPAASTSTSAHQAVEEHQEPLFLPGTPDETESEVEIIGYKPATVPKKRTQKKIVNRAYVLVPPPSSKVRRIMRQKTGLSHRTLVSETESEEDFSVPLEHINVIDKAAQEAIRLSASRIEMLPCKWDGCDVVTNCAQTLVTHLQKVHQGHHVHFTCLWTQCGRRCHQSENHLEKHASIPYRCAYKGCAETFRSGSSLLKHFRRHHKSGQLKPSARPVAVTVLKPLPNLPTGTLPAYLALSRVAQPASISPQLHDRLGPWVLRNINESDTSQTWQKKKSRQNEATPGGGNPGADYEFLITRTLRPSSYLSTPAHVELADIEMNSELYEGRRFDDSVVLFDSRAKPEDVDVEELNSRNSPLFGSRSRDVNKELIEAGRQDYSGDG